MHESKSYLVANNQDDEISFKELQIGNLTPPLQTLNKVLPGLTAASFEKNTILLEKLTRGVDGTITVNLRGKDPMTFNADGTSIDSNQQLVKTDDEGYALVDGNQRVTLLSMYNKEKI